MSAQGFARLTVNGSVRAAVVSTVIPVETRPPENGGTGNSRAALIMKSKRNKDQRQAGFWYVQRALLLAGLRPTDLVPCVVTITRVGRGKLDDDNVAAACKHVRDGIADALGIDDGGPFVRWLYDQERQKEKGNFLRVRIEKR